MSIYMNDFAENSKLILLDIEPIKDDNIISKIENIVNYTCNFLIKC